jgi:glycosyltransferase involved in cell wall biosynthesis
MNVISCGSPYGQGGVGQHFAQVVEAARTAGTLARYYSPQPLAGDAAGRALSLGAFRTLREWTPLRYSQTWTSWAKGEVIDRQVARRLLTDGPGHAFVGFVGKALHSFESAASLGAVRLELVALNPHPDRLLSRHADAARMTGIRDSWMNAAQAHKTRREIERADVVHVHSEYTLRSFLDAGVPEHKLRRMSLFPDARFRPPARRVDDGVFRVAYVGRLEATKGVPLLLDAFARLPGRRAELTLVGGASTRSMRRFVERAMRRDPRIRLAPGDPLPVLQRADVLVHPTFEDGFGYAPVEALACGVPVVVTEDTGMKEYVRDGVNGYVVPTGHAGALLDRMGLLARRPLRPAPLRLGAPPRPTPSLAAP